MEHITRQDGKELLDKLSAKDEKASGGVDFYEDYKNDVLLPQIEKSFPNHILIEKEEFERMDALASERILELSTKPPEPLRKGGCYQWIYCSECMMIDVCLNQNKEIPKYWK